MLVKGKYNGLIVLSFVVLFATVVVRCAWLSDDAYITFRTVYNFTNGYGLTWNTAERVQVYSNPLWMLLLSALYYLSREMYYSSIFLSIAISLITVLLVSFYIARSTASAILGITILIFSKAFIDYSTSGLENPLTHLILVLFFIVYFKRQLSCKWLFLLSMTASLGVFNRMDTALLFLPTLSYALWKHQDKTKGIFIVLLGFIPFVMWECFSLFYYGFAFPNTAYAKLNTGIETSDLAMQGLHYLLNSLVTDPLTILIIIESIVFSILAKDMVSMPVIGGIVLYLLYIIKIGGDFMSGRFITAPLICAVIIIARNFLICEKKFWAPVLFTVLLIGFISPHSPAFSGADYGIGWTDLEDENGITDERGYYYDSTGLFVAHRKLWWDESGLSKDYGDSGKKWNGEESSVVVKRNTIGINGFYAGPRVYVVDLWSIADPLRSRLPIKKDSVWRIGHFERKIPEGYLETLESGENRIKDEKLAAFYDKLSIIIRGRLFDSKRLIEILKMNIGMYDHYLNSWQ
ncbi:MAG: hypothetical protein HZA77_08695 [Candidatus Schekmanbacteria bacterium]|nr:hypothetical protein [Candidatus Schekmanbacteria bacterium]